MITIQVTKNAGLKAIQALDQKKQIKIIEQIDLDSPSLPNSALSLKAFRDWIAEAEREPTVSSKEAKKQWAEQKKQILKLIRSDMHQKR